MLTAQINPPLHSKLLGFLVTETQECRTLVRSGLLWKLEHRNRKKKHHSKLFGFLGTGMQNKTWLSLKHRNRKKTYGHSLEHRNRKKTYIGSSSKKTYIGPTSKKNIGSYFLWNK